MIKFKKLKVKGFKSFVEPTEIIIENGLTGIVGPNGCGKSNLVEAFRFVMGELSPKQMRGGELDDVIFNGTAERPAWDIAEVTLELDNKLRKAPNIFNGLHAEYGSENTISLSWQSVTCLLPNLATLKKL